MTNSKSLTNRNFYLFITQSYYTASEDMENNCIDCLYDILWYSFDASFCSYLPI